MIRFWQPSRWILWFYMANIKYINELSCRLIWYSFPNVHRWHYVQLFGALASQSAPQGITDIAVSPPSRSSLVRVTNKANIARTDDDCIFTSLCPDLGWHCLPWDHTSVRLHCGRTTFLQLSRVMHPSLSNALERLLISAIVGIL